MIVGTMPESILNGMSKLKFLRKYLGRPFLRASERLWPLLAPGASFAPIYSYGSFIQSLIRLREPRTQYHGTYFFRNRPELELMRVLLSQRAEQSTLRMSVLACSNGAEAYSILWTIRSAFPDLQIIMNAVDISQDILEMARKGLYSFKVHELVNSQIFERLTESELKTMFDEEGNGLFRIKPWLSQGINWCLADATDPQLPSRLGLQDIVVANRFLCHMAPPDAESCLRNIARLVRPGGYLFVSGVDLDVRTKVAVDLGWSPVTQFLEEIHDGDPSLRRDWPLRYWGLEPLCRKKPDWSIRYASVFQLNHQTDSLQMQTVSSEQTI